MTLAEDLRSKSDHIIDDAMAQLRQAHLEHYEAEGLDVARDRLLALLGLTLRCLEEGRADSLLAYIDTVARGRYSAGYALLEVQTSVNVLEEALWKRVLASVEPEELAYALGQISTVLGMCKDNMARTYVELARAGT